MKFSPEKLAAEAEATGFRPDVLEKVAHLLGLLDAMRSHPFLKGKLVLKGGTALNLFVFDVPRLSVDIDLNYVGAEDREAMLAERPKIEQAVQAVFSREGFNVRRMPEEHAGGKWSDSSDGRPRFPSTANRVRCLRRDEQEGLEDGLCGRCRLRSRGVGQAVDPHAARQCGRGQDGISRIRGAPNGGVPGRSIRGAALHGFRAGVLGSAAGPRDDRPDDFDRRRIPSTAYTRPAASGVEGSQCEAS